MLYIPYAVYIHVYYIDTYIHMYTYYRCIYTYVLICKLFHLICCKSFSTPVNMQLQMICNDYIILHYIGI